MTMGAPAVRKGRRQRLGRFVQQNILTKHLGQMKDLTLKEFTRNRAFILFQNLYGLQCTRPGGGMAQFKLLLDLEGDGLLKIAIAAAAWERDLRVRLASYQ